MDDIIKDFHDLTEIPPFQQMISDKKYMDTEEYLDVLQMNIGRKCNLICKHCHVNAGPARTEEMSREVMDACLTFAKEQKIVTIDITGGAPEMNPHLEYLIEESSKICGHVIVRTNLVILLEKEYEHLMEVYARNKVEVVCSLPYYRAPEMDKVRGAGAFDKAIKVIRRLNAMGYGRNQELQKNGESGKPINWGNEAEMKAEALKIAKEADVIICAMGESAEMSGECGSRTNLEMPDVQRELLAELLKTGKPVVLLNFAGRPTVLTWENAHVPAIMNVWFGGSEMGDALCDVIFGDKSPSGKLTTSMPKTTGQEPLYYNHQNTGRPVADDNEKFAKFASNCLDVSNGPLYPFGYGLSYTYFSYSNFRLSSQEAGISNEEATEWQDGKKITASVTVKNNGSRNADEIVQLYIRDMVASISRPVKELKGFQRIHLAVGESKEVSFDITPDMLKFYNADLKHVIEPGDFQIMIGTNSKDVKTLKLNVK